MSGVLGQRWSTPNSWEGEREEEEDGFVKIINTYIFCTC